MILVWVSLVPIKTESFSRLKEDLGSKESSESHFSGRRNNLRSFGCNNYRNSWKKFNVSNFKPSLSHEDCSCDYNFPNKIWDLGFHYLKPLAIWLIG